MEFIESGLHFRFGEEWVIKKYDAHRFYQGLSGSGLKGVDFLGILGEGLFLFEIKNFRRRRQWQEENPLEAVLDHPSEFAENIAYKVEDTLLAIDAIWQYYNRKWLFRRLLPAFRRLPVTENDWRFWARAYALMQDPGQVNVVLWMETERARPALLTEIEAALQHHLQGRAGSVRIALRGNHDFLRGFELASGA
ncbi:MAG: hypothetical protein H6558_08620 [Lewinellaceae bacterium]|nr:hypothetical protein [Lewinellaceae bacterium]MCB9287392.1 hypothetical protein [Lewinellaceae bacterium]